MAQDVRMAVLIDGDSKGLQNAMAAGAAASEASGKSISLDLAKIGKRMAQATIAAATLGVALTFRYLKKSVTTFVEFELAMARMAATLGETNRETGEINESMQDLEMVIRNIAKESQATASEVARAGNVLALAGLRFEELGNETEGAIKSLVDFSVVAGVDVESAAGIVISSVKGMGIAIEDMDRVMDVFVTTMTSSFVDLTTLGMAMKFLAPTANAAGLEIEEAAAAVGALGDAGLQGTIAGTGLRMSINKLLSPTDDARRVMDRLGLNFLTLTPAGESARNTMVGLSTSIGSMKAQVEKTSAAMDILNGKLDDISIDQQKNQLAIMQIRARADREGRQLTADEIKRIQKLEEANQALSVEQFSVSLKQRIAQRDAKKQNKVLAEQEKQYNSLNEVVTSQTMGLTSLSDVVNQLADSGATTAEILEIFSVRGGTAIMALMGQRQGFLDLVEANYLAEGATESYLKTVKQTVDYQIKQVISAFEETRIVVGELFAELIGLASANDGKIASSLKNVAYTLADNKDEWIELRDAIADDLLPLIAGLPSFVDRAMVAFRLAVPFIKAFANAMKILGTLMKPVFWLLEKIADLFEAAEDSWWGRILSDMFVGATSGAVVGSAVPVVGTGIGAGIGALAGGIGGVANEFHAGGITDNPTAGIFGEAGREALVPLTKYDMELTKKSSPMGVSSSNSGLTINFDSITINGGGHMTSSDVRSIIRTEMPKIVKDSYRGARGVI
jgi:TP901 family phage tail tape measure protein